MGGRLHLYLQRCGSPRRLSLRCPPLGSPAAALLLPGFCPPRTEAQTVSVRKEGKWSCTPCFLVGRASVEKIKGHGDTDDFIKAVDSDHLFHSVSPCLCSVLQPLSSLSWPFCGCAEEILISDAADHSVTCCHELKSNWCQTAKLSPRLNVRSLLSNRLQVWL